MCVDVHAAALYCTVGRPWLLCCEFVISVVACFGDIVVGGSLRVFKNHPRHGSMDDPQIDPMMSP